MNYICDATVGPWYHEIFKCYRYVIATGAMYIKYELVFLPFNIVSYALSGAVSGCNYAGLAARLIARVRIIYREPTINPSVEFGNYFDRITIRRNLGMVLLLIDPSVSPAGVGSMAIGYHPLDGHRFSHIATLRATFSNLPFENGTSLIIDIKFHFKRFSPPSTFLLLKEVTINLNLLYDLYYKSCL